MVPSQQHDRRGAVGQSVHKVDARIIWSAAFDDLDAVQGRVQVQEIVPAGVTAHVVGDLRFQRVFTCAHGNGGVVPRALDFGGAARAHHPHVVKVQVEAEIDVLRADVEHQRRVHGHAQFQALLPGSGGVAATVANEGRRGEAVDEGAKLVCAALVP